MNDDEHREAIMQEVSALEHKFNLLSKTLPEDEWFVVWCEIIKRDFVDAQLREQNKLQAYIRHAEQIIAERKAELMRIENSDDWPLGTHPDFPKGIK